MPVGIKTAVNWLVDNDDLTNLIAADYSDEDLGCFSVTMMFVVDCYQITTEQLATKIHREIQKRGW